MEKMNIALIVFLLIPLSYAYTQNSSDYEVTFLTASSISTNQSDYAISSIDEVYIGEINTSNFTIEKGILYLLPQEEVAAVIQQIIQSSGGYVQIIKAVTPFYDLLLEIDKDLYLSQPNNFFRFLYYKDDIINFNITIVNRGDIADKDAELKYYLLSPNNTIYKENKQIFIEVPITCVVGEYDIQSNSCKINNTYIPSEAFTINDQMTLPLGAERGEWKFVTYYNSTAQTPFDVSTTFEVGKKFNYIYLIVLCIILTIIYILLATRKGEDNEKE